MPPDAVSGQHVDCAVGFSLCVLGLSRHRPLLTDPKVPRHYQKACQWSVTADSAHFTTHVVISTPSNLGFHGGTTQDGLVGMATRYRLVSPGIESRLGGQDFPHPSRPALGPNQPPVQ